MSPKQVNEAFVNHTVVKYGVSKVYVIGINSIRNEATIKMAAHPDLPPIEAKYIDLREVE